MITGETKQFLDIHGLQLYDSIVEQKIAAAIGGSTEIEVEVVSELPVSGLSHTIYFVPTPDSAVTNAHDEYMFVNNVWELIGSTRIDLSDYYTVEQTDYLLEQKSDVGHTHEQYSLTSHTHTAAEIGALPDSTVIPTSTSQLSNDSGFITGETDPTVHAWAKAENKPTYEVSEISGLTEELAGKSNVGHTHEEYSLTSHTHSEYSLTSHTHTAADVGALPDDTVIPSKTSDLTNDSGFITGETDPTVHAWAKAENKPTYEVSEISGLTETLLNYYTTGETYTQTEVNNLIAAIDQFHYEIYADLSGVTDPQGNVLYLIGPSGTGSDQYEEYVYANSIFTKIGDTTIDLSDYATTSALTTGLAGKSDIGHTHEQYSLTSHTHTAQEIGALPDSTVIPSKTSDLTNDSGFITGYTLPIAGSDVLGGVKINGNNLSISNDGTLSATDTTYSASDFDIKDLSDATGLKTTWSEKQDVINDLEEIRSGATLGATALQEVPSEYITDTELEAALEDYTTTTALTEGLAEKQNVLVPGVTITIDTANTINVADWLLPVGSITMWALPSEPEGWLICNGQSITGDTYSELRGILSADTVPDLTGRFPLGVSQTHALNETGGTEEVTLTIDEIPSHNHEIENIIHEVGTLSTDYRTFNLNSMGGKPTKVEQLNPVQNTENTGGGLAHNNMPPYFTLNFIIKYKSADGGVVPPTPPTPTTVTATFVDYDGTTLYTTQVEAGTTPVYGGATPTRQDTYNPSTDIWTEYSFNDWSPTLGPISVNTTYTAQYGEAQYRYVTTTKFVREHQGSENTTKQYILVALDSYITGELYLYVNGSWNSSSKLYACIPGTIETETSFDDLEEFTWPGTMPTVFLGLENASSNYYMKDLSDNGYLIANNSSNSFATKQTSTASATSLWQWHLDSNDEIINDGASPERAIEYNYNQGNPRFAPYKHTQTATYLFYKDETTKKEYIVRGAKKSSGKPSIPEFIITGPESNPTEVDEDPEVLSR